MLRGSMFEQFSNQARQAVNLAGDQARRQNRNYIDSGHLLLGLLAEGEGAAARTLESLGVTLAAARQQMEELVGVGYDAQTEGIKFTPRANQALKLAQKESSALGHSYVGTEHILFGLIRQDDGIATLALAGLGVDMDRARQRVVKLLHEQG